MTTNTRRMTTRNMFKDDEESKEKEDATDIKLSSLYDPTRTKRTTTKTMRRTVMIARKENKNYEEKEEKEDETD